MLQTQRRFGVGKYQIIEQACRVPVIAKIFIVSNLRSHLNIAEKHCGTIKNCILLKNWILSTRNGQFRKKSY